LRAARATRGTGRRVEIGDAPRVEVVVGILILLRHKSVIPRAPGGHEILDWTSMSQAQVRRFPPVSGPYGWAGAVFVLLAFASQVVAAFLLFWAVLNRDGRFVIPTIICFVLSFPLIGAAVALWGIGAKRSGTLRPSTLPKDRQRQLLAIMAILNLVGLAGVGMFVYLALRLEGTRRFIFALVPVFLAMAGMQLCLRRAQQLRNRPPPWFLGLPPERGTILVVALSLICAALLLLAGFFWTPI
jgi:hypothetical protein